MNPRSFIPSKAGSILRSTRVKYAVILGAMVLAACSEQPVEPGPRRMNVQPSFALISAAASGYVMTELPRMPGAFTTIANAINDAGDITGVNRFTPALGNNRAVVWPADGSGPRELLFASSQGASAINSRGDVAGNGIKEFDADVGQHVVLWSADGQAQDLTPGLSVSLAVARGINDAGDVVGELLTGEGVVHATRFRVGQDPVDLGSTGVFSRAYDINANGLIVGNVGTAAGTAHAVLWNGDAITDLDPASTISEAFAINDNGEIAGYSDSWGDQHATIWHVAGAPARDLGVGGGIVSFATGINNAGDVVGVFTEADGVNHGILWPADGGPSVDFGPGTHLTGINSSGTIIGWVASPIIDGVQTLTAFRWTRNTRAPIANAGGPYTSTEGGNITFDASATDAAGQTLSYSWSFGDGSPAATGAAPVHAYSDNGTYTVTLSVSGGGTTSTATSTATISNVAPSVGAIFAPAAPVQVGAAVNATASFSDPGTLDTHTGTVSWGDGTSSPAAISESFGSGTAGGSHTYSTPGVYTVTLNVTDDDGDTGHSVLEYIVAFDPAAGFVTGSGWINSPVGAFSANPSLTGKATFGFVSRYQKGAKVPSGDTQFQFNAVGLSFKSTSYDWLVIAGSTAKYKGSGTINGGGDYEFMLSAVDGDMNGKGFPDRFRIKISNKLTGAVIYDNESGAQDDAAASTAIGGGSIVIHS